METVIIIALVLMGGLGSCSKKSSKSTQIKYTAEYEYPAPPELRPGDGVVELEALGIKSCKDSNGLEVDLKNCEDLGPYPVLPLSSPPGTVTIPVSGAVNGHVKISVSEGENVSQISQTDLNIRVSDVLICDEGFVKHFHECKVPGFELILSNYTAPTKTTVCSGQEFLTRTILGCRDSVTSLDASMDNCSDLTDPLPQKINKSPYGERDLVVDGDNVREKCEEGDTAWSRISITCNNPIEHEESLDCVPDSLVATTLVYPENILKAGEGTLEVSPVDFETCFNTTKTVVVSKELCTLPVAVTITYQSPFGQRDVEIEDYVSHEEVLEGATEWVRVDVTCLNPLEEKSGSGASSQCVPKASPATATTGKKYSITAGAATLIDIEINNPDSVKTTCEISPSLPVGLTLNGCQITGVTSVTSKKEYSIEVTSLTEDDQEIGRKVSNIEIKTGIFSRVVESGVIFSNYKNSDPVMISDSEILLLGSSDTVIYNFDTNTHQTYNTTPETRNGGTMVYSELGRVYYLGGAKVTYPSTSNFVNYVEYFDIAAKTWIRTSHSFNLNGIRFVLNNLGGGQFFVTEGLSGNLSAPTQLNTFSIFNATTGEIISLGTVSTKYAATDKEFIYYTTPSTSNSGHVASLNVYSLTTREVINSLPISESRINLNNLCITNSGVNFFNQSILPGQVAGFPIRYEYDKSLDTFTETLYAGSKPNQTLKGICRNDGGFAFMDQYNAEAGILLSNEETLEVSKVKSLGLQAMFQIILNLGDGRGVVLGDSVGSRKVLIYDTDFKP